MSRKWAIALHGGAGPVFGRDYSREEAHIAGLLREGGRRLAEGVSALDVVEAMVAELEESGLYLAGRGAAPNSAGQYELDAAIMDGRTRNAGAVAALRGFISPVAAARAVMERTPHVLIVGDGARLLAKSCGLAEVDACGLHEFGGDALAELLVGVDAGADGGAAEGQATQHVQGAVEAVLGVGHLGGEA